MLLAGKVVLGGVGPHAGEGIAEGQAHAGFVYPAGRRGLNALSAQPVGQREMGSDRVVRRQQAPGGKDVGVKPSAGAVQLGELLARRPDEIGVGGGEGVR